MPGGCQRCSRLHTVFMLGGLPPSRRSHGLVYRPDSFPLIRCHYAHTRSPIMRETETDWLSRFLTFFVECCHQDDSERASEQINEIIK